VGRGAGSGKIINPIRGDWSYPSLVSLLCFPPYQTQAASCQKSSFQLFQGKGGIFRKKKKIIVKKKKKKGPRNEYHSSRLPEKGFLSPWRLKGNRPKKMRERQGVFRKYYSQLLKGKSKITKQGKKLRMTGERGRRGGEKPEKRKLITGKLTFSWRLSL